VTDIGDVIVAARLARGFKHTDLLGVLGVTQAALSRYENNLRTPDDEILGRLSAALGVTVPFMRHAFRLQGALAADAHMRRRKTTKASHWKLAEARLNLLRMRSAYLFERLPLTVDSYVPTFDPGDTQPADAARMVRAQWRMPIGPVRDLTGWMESAGVLVAEEDMGTHRIDGLSQWAADYPVVLINSSLSPDRKRLTLAHELGHLVLHATYVDQDPEQQANDFAGEFLMPEHVIAPALRSLTLGRLLELKGDYGVSMQAVFERAYRMGRVSRDERTRFYRAMNARGWKVEEPGADRVAVERPKLARAAGESLRAAGLSDGEIAELTGVNQVALAAPFLDGVTRHLRPVSGSSTG
jgi:Zn-dependent peptidase ImmA (M78 family)